MRTVSLALLLSLSLAVACSADKGDGAEAPMAEDHPAAATETHAVPAPPAASAASSAAPVSPAPIDEASEEPVVPVPPSDAGAPPADAAPPQDGGVLIAEPILLVGRIVATSSDSWCNFYVDGAYKASASSIDVTVAIGDHEIRCDGANGRTATALVNVSFGETETVTMQLPPVVPAKPGTLIAVAVGGSCTFAVNGASKGTSSQLELTLPPGAYSVSCKPASGAQKTRSVVIKPGETAMAMFKL